MYELLIAFVVGALSIGLGFVLGARIMYRANSGAGGVLFDGKPREIPDTTGEVVEDEKYA